MLSWDSFIFAAEFPKVFEKQQSGRVANGFDAGEPLPYQLQLIQTNPRGRHFLYNDKDRNGKRYPFADVNNFWHLLWKTFCYFDRANSIKTNLQTCNLQTIQSISYKSIHQFWLNLPYPNSKTFSTSNVKNNPHLQGDIFCHFDFCHSRRNALGIGVQFCGATLINSRYAVSAYHCFAGVVKMFENVEFWPDDLKSLDLFIVVAGAYNSRKNRNESKFEIQVFSNALKLQILKYKINIVHPDM